MIYKDEILFTDRWNDVLSVAPRKGLADPTICVTHNIGADREGFVINSGTSQSIVFTEEQFVSTILPELVKRVLGENYTVEVKEV